MHKRITILEFIAIASAILFTAFALSAVVSSLRAQITGSTSLTVRTTGPPSVGALLTGVTVLSSGPNGTLSAPIPSGWHLVWAENFENGVTPGEIFSNGNIQSAHPHTGSNAFQGHLDCGIPISCGPGWTLDTGHTGSFTEIVISWWEWVSSNAFYGNSDFFFGGIAQQGVCGQVQDIQFDMQSGNGASSRGAVVTPVSEGADPPAGGREDTCMGKYQFNIARGMQINQGFYRQYEEHIRPSTTVGDVTSCVASNNGSDCTGNGGLAFYVDGQALIPQADGLDLNGTQNMANAQVGVGGVLTDLSGCGDWNAPTCTGSRPGSLPPLPFDRAMDDIAIIAR